MRANSQHANIDGGSENLIHDDLTKHAERHKQINKKLGRLTTISKPNGELYDFDKTHFEARPKAYSPLIVNFLAKLTMHTTPGELAVNFDDNYEKIKQARVNGRTLLITGHRNMFEPMAALLGLQSKISAEEELSFQEVAMLSHVMGTRTAAYSKLLGTFNLVNVARNVSNVHLTFPDTVTFRGHESNIPRNFLGKYAVKMLNNFETATQNKRSIAALAAGSRNEQLVDGSFIMPTVSKGLNKRVIANGWNIMAVAGAVVDGKLEICVDDPVLFNDVTEDTVHQKMQWIASQKTKMKPEKPTVYMGS